MKRPRLTRIFNQFFQDEQASGIVLLACTIFSILISNSIFGEAYLKLWHTPIGIQIGEQVHLTYSLEFWINDGLLVIFFLLIGLEIKRELFVGEISNPKSASLPIIAAIGGMLTPMLIYLLFNMRSSTRAGFGIPMATDIAFALGVLALLRKYIPTSLKVFLVALAIIDDLGAILVIAIFYTHGFSLSYFGLALLMVAVLFVMNRMRFNWVPIFLIPGIFLWYFMLKSGIHTTIAGVLLAFAIPFEADSMDAPLYRLEGLLSRPVAFLIMPLFALANTSIHFSGDWLSAIVTTNTLGILFGLVVGKPLGISFFSWLAVKIGMAKLPDDVQWKQIIGAGMLGGIGFTMSIFIAVLAFDSFSIEQASKVSILASSILAGSMGYFVLRTKS
ncbi:MAG TPA: Na+/H+ antiporter NhaA [Anaerolineales bacterium]|nr:Na+/H+ antiporter NhaA [Anaerolineales bacterium]